MWHKHGRGRVRLGCAAAAALAVTAAGCTAGGWDGPERSAPPEVDWVACEDELAEAGLECGTVSVPLDWDDPDGERLTVALTRRAADDPAERLGVLLLNPGGPGGAGRSVPAAAAAHFVPEVLERFDLVGFDPRGVGASEAIDCRVTLATSVPADADAYAERLERSREQGVACEEANPQLAHVDTVSAAHDVDAIRAALGEEEINWYGWSYGTQLGATYAEHYPERVRAMVADSMYDHSRPSAAIAVDQAEAREVAFERFAHWCAEHDCVDGDPAAAWDGLVAAADAAPLPVAPGGDLPETVDGDMVVDATAALLSSPDHTWPALGEAIAAGLDGDGSGFAAMFADGGTVAPMVAIRCLDWPADPAAREFDHVAALAERAAERAPRFGAHAQWYYAPECLEWPIEAVNPPAAPRVDTPSPVLVVGAEYDPATPYAWAEAAAASFANAALLTYAGDGHGASGHSACVRERAGAYLVAPRTPPAGEVCD